MDNQSSYPVAVTAIVAKDDKFLITRRSLNKKKWPNMWTVPGGKLESSDYENLPKDTSEAWYNVLEGVVRREVKEETGLEIKNIRYITSLMAQHSGSGEHTLIISLLADWHMGDVVLQEEECYQHAWVSAEDSKNYELIPGIYEELVMAEKMLTESKEEWKPGRLAKIDDFVKLEFRVGKVMSAETVEKSEKLLKLHVDDGTVDGRQILAGIAKYYPPESIVGRQIVFVSNLEPRKLLNLESQGMILAAHDEGGGAVLLMPDKEVPQGSKIS